MILPLPQAPFDALVPSLWLPEARLDRKSEFHLTLLSRSEAGAVAARIPEAAWRETFDQGQWRVHQTGAYWLHHDPLAAEGPRWSVVERLEVPALARFRACLAQRAGVVLTEAPPHVTLWVAGHAQGIGLASASDWQRTAVRQLEARALTG